VHRNLPDVYDDRPLRGPRRPRRWPIVFAVVALIGAGAAGWWFLLPHPKPPRFDSGPVHVVHDRPGGGVARAEAVGLLRRRLGQSVSSECLAIIGKGSTGSVYLFTALNRCDSTRLGDWRVDVKSGAVSRK